MEIFCYLCFENISGIAKPSVVPVWQALLPVS